MANDLFETTKAPEEILDYVIDWTDELELSNPTDQVSTSVWTLEDNHSDDLTLGAASIEGTDHTTQRVSDGGRFGVIHFLVNRVVTISGMKHQRTINVTMGRR